MLDFWSSNLFLKKNGKEVLSYQNASVEVKSNVIPIPIILYFEPFPPFKIIQTLHNDLTLSDNE